MRTEQITWTTGRGWAGEPTLRDAQLVLVFGDRHAFTASSAIPDLHLSYPAAQIVGASTAGEIGHDGVQDGTIVATAIRFDRTRIQVASAEIPRAEASRAAGRAAAEALPQEGLVHVLAFADGTITNGSELVRGIVEGVRFQATITGGLAGDGARFEETSVLVGGKPLPRHVTLVGLYGNDLHVGYGSIGGWDPHGPSRAITRSQGNVVFEIDGRPALDVYKEVLGDKAGGLPATGLLFPLLVRVRHAEVVRTLLGVNEAERSLTFAGDVPERAVARFMKADFDRLVEGAALAGRDSRRDDVPPDLALLVSCVGRKLILQDRTLDEVHAVSRALGGPARVAGFYSYGEISPIGGAIDCALHNQTMTVTTLRER